MSAVAKKKAVDLSTVTVAPPPPERMESDTTTKIDSPVERFTAIHMNKWTPWLSARMAQHWPHINAWNFPTVISQHWSQNESLLIKSQKAIMLAVMTKEPIDPRPVVDIVFMFKFHPQDTEENKFVRPLFRQADEWGKSKGARAVRLNNVEHTDLSQSQAKEMLYGKDAGVLVKDLDG